MKRDLGLVALSLFIWGIGEGMFFYFQPLYLQEFGADPLEIGGILGGYGIAMAAAHIPAGYLADRLGRRIMMWIPWFMGVLATLIMALAGSLPVFVTGLLLYGLTYFVLVPMNSYVTAARGSWSVGRAITLVSAAFNLGMVFGPLLGGYIGEFFGLRSIFRVSAGIFVLSTLVILLIRSQPVEKPAPQEKSFDFLRSRPYLVYLAAVFLAVFATYLPQPLSQNFLSNQRGLSLSQIGLLTSVTGLGVAVLSFRLGALEARKGFLLAQAAVGFFALLMWQGSQFYQFAIAYFLMGGYKTTRSLAAAQTRDLVFSSRMGLAYGVTETFGSVATILAPLLAGYLYSRQPVWMYAASVFLIGISILASRAAAPKTAPAPVVEATYSIQE